MEFHRKENMGLENETARVAAANRGRAPFAPPAPTPDGPTGLCSLIDEQHLEANDFHRNLLGYEYGVNIDTLLGLAPPPAPAAVTGSGAARPLVDGGSFYLSFGSNNNYCFSTNIFGTGGGSTNSATAVTLPHDDERHQNFKGYQTINISSITAKGKEAMIGVGNKYVSNRSNGCWDRKDSTSAISTHHDPSLASVTPLPSYTDCFDSLRQPPADRKKRTVKQRRSRLSSLSFANNSNTGSQTQVPRPLRVRPALPAPPSISARVLEVRRLKFLFSKQLRSSDVGDLNRIIIPKKNAVAHLPALENKEGIVLDLTDMSGLHVWRFRYRYWLNPNSCMYVLENAGDFVRTHRLEYGDTISLFKDSENLNYVIEGKKGTEPLYSFKVEEKKTKKKKNKRKSNSSGAFNLAWEDYDMMSKRDDMGFYYPAPPPPPPPGDQHDNNIISSPPFIYVTADISNDSLFDFLGGDLMTSYFTRNSARKDEFCSIDQFSPEWW